MSTSLLESIRSDVTGIWHITPEQESLRCANQSDGNALLIKGVAFVLLVYEEIKR